MHILINNIIPSNNIEALTKVMKGNKPVSFEAIGVGEYEENIEWESLTIAYENDVVEFGDGYTGAWEIMCFNSLHDNAQIALSNDLLGWAIDHINYENEEIAALRDATDAVNRGVDNADNIVISEDVTERINQYQPDSHPTIFGVSVLIDGNNQHVALHTKYNNEVMDAILNLHIDSTNKSNIRIVMEHLFFLNSMYVQFEYYKYHSPTEKLEKENES